jgi:homoserine kinase type II
MEGMAESSLDGAARAVLSRYPAVHGGFDLLPLGNRGGFSGARLWRVEASGGPYCLRAWPAAGPSAERLGGIHRLMTRARDVGLVYVPFVVPAAGGSTTMEEGGRMWDLTGWQPGRADFHERPTRARLEAACTALAHVHDAWKPAVPSLAPCPAVHRRLAAVRAWQELTGAGWRPSFGRADPVRPWAERAWQVVQARIADVPSLLAPWVQRPVSLQACLCDVWHDHLLFQEDRVTGLIDYGSVQIDHVAVDLARLLGSLVGDRIEDTSAGLDCYGRLRGLSAEERALVALLDRTGTFVGLTNWLRWIYRDRRTYEDPAAVAQRLAALVERAEVSR